MGPWCHPAPASAFLSLLNMLKTTRHRRKHWRCLGGTCSPPATTQPEWLLLRSEKPHQPGAVQGHSPEKSLRGHHEILGKGWGKPQDRFTVSAGCDKGTQHIFLAPSFPQEPPQQAALPGCVCRCPGELQFRLRPGLPLARHPCPGGSPQPCAEAGPAHGILVRGKRRGYPC